MATFNTSLPFAPRGIKSMSKPPPAMRRAKANAKAKAKNRGKNVVMGSGGVNRGTNKANPHRSIRSGKRGY